MGPSFTEMADRDPLLSQFNNPSDQKPWAWVADTDDGKPIKADSIKPEFNDFMNQLALKPQVLTEWVQRAQSHENDFKVGNVEGEVSLTDPLYQS